MKKCLLLLTTVFISATATAQFTIWEDDFNDGNASDWTLLDLDGNASNWIARKNIQMSAENTIVGGTKSILGTYNIDFATLGYLGTAENNWAISPAIDLSYYGGTISLILNAQCAVYDGPFPIDIKIYASNSPAQSSFVEVGNVNMLRISPDADEFTNYTVNISQFSGQSEVYFALVVNNGNGFVGAEIDNIRIDADEILSVNDPKGLASSSFISQNPVAENLYLKLGNTVDAGNLNLKIYNVSGMLIKEATYNEAGISVSELSSGMYFTVLHDGASTEHLKFIKK